MSTLHIVKLGGVAVHKDRAVSTGAFSLNVHDSSYIMSAKKAVLKVCTLSCKSTNMQLTDFYNPGGQIQIQSSCLETAQYFNPSCHFLLLC